MLGGAAVQGGNVPDAAGLGSQLLGESVGVQLVLLAAAFVLCSVIGLERQARRKSAGYRTHVLVGLGSCVFTLVSAYGFSAFFEQDGPRDPTRIAAQVVSGIGFLGAGVIFKGSSTVRGLTTAGSIWIAAAVGMASGAGMVGLAAAVTAIYVLVLFLVAPLIHRLPMQHRDRSLVVSYVDGTGALRAVLEQATLNGFSTSFERLVRERVEGGADVVTVQLRFEGGADPAVMGPVLAELAHVVSVRRAGGVSPYEEEDDD